MPKKLNDYLWVTPLEFFKKNRLSLCRVVGCGGTVSGDTATRPTSPSVGEVYFDTTLGYPIWYNGTDWVNSAGDIQV